LTVSTRYGNLICTTRTSFSSSEILTITIGQAAAVPAALGEPVVVRAVRPAAAVVAKGQVPR
jgi:hypothetical protein